MQPHDSRYRELLPLAGKVFFNGVSALENEGAVLQIHVHCKPGFKWQVTNVVNAVLDNLYREGVIPPPYQRLHTTLES